MKMLVFFFLSLFAELGLYNRFIWKHHRYGALYVLSLVVVTQILGFWFFSAGHQALLLLIALFRIVNLSRLTYGRMKPEYLLKACRKTSFYFSALHALFFALVYLPVRLNTDAAVLLLATLQLSAALLFVGITAKNIFKTKHHTTDHFYSDKELPTLTVAIPARNETQELASCLENILANNYPKLEVLVLDDCSQDTTADIIKHYAHAGVRFLKGSQPADGWLAKNHAYNQLASEASGEYVMFCGVDVRVGPEFLRSSVTTLLNKDREMISVMPIRLQSGLRVSIVQPIRYWWDLALPRKLFNRPSVLSTCWLIQKKRLMKLGGFAAVSQNVTPEGYFARELVKTDDYAFVRSDDRLEIKTVKDLPAQHASAVRVRYPQLHRRLEVVFLLFAAEVMFFVLPIIFVLLGFVAGFGLVQVLAGLTVLLLTFNHAQIISVSNPANTHWAIVNFPLVVLYELWVTNYSMMQYEFGSVIWKGRNICLPTSYTKAKTN